MKTIKQIKNKLNNLQSQHEQINSFRWYEDNSEVEVKLSLDDQFVFMGAILQPGNLAQRFEAIRLNIFIADLVNSDNSNLTEVINDTNLIAKDIFALFSEWSQDNDMKLVENAPFSHFVEKDGHCYAGWLMDVTLNQLFSKDTCQVPGSGAEDDQSQYVSIINQDDEIIATRLPGQSYEVLELTEITDTGFNNTTTITDPF